MLPNLPPMVISIHAPHEGERLTHGFSTPELLGHFNPRSPRGGATPSPPWRRRQRNISIHAPHEGERRPKDWINLWGWVFQSTLPTRGSDAGWSGCCLSWATNFNPRSPRGGATIVVNVHKDLLRISIHAPHEGERLALRDIFGAVDVHEGERP